ncbi:S41 family peptidase [Criibacterium bergeronii]|uniref:PDZ domain-containing protein n=1 Tax=Criibacterium bergeronii TaxID=1871336 RepID=A0A371IJF5_9FIRM|nr:S41 family peptidase [Criibacterium bergeronii]MBS6063834.1 PDZ domain-containing protein [Peptostreptococcaceae bacterium]RDY20605.1 PDZ domain-containing protein [Criibacterium bergeronii]
MQDNNEFISAPKKKHKSKYGLVFISGIITGILIYLFINIYSNRAYGMSLQEYMNINSFIDMTEKYYYKDTKDVDYNVGIRKGIVESLGDPYSRYLSKEEFSKMMEETTGEFVGIGVYIGPTQDGKIGVIAPIKGSPAEKAGIKTGDIIITVNGKPYDAKTMDEAVRNMKGKEGEKVVLELVSVDKKLKKLTIIKSPIHTQTVSSKALDNGIGYMQIISFEGKTAQEFSENLASLKQKNIKGLIIDLRSNPGGMVDQVVKIADEILPQAMIVYTQNKAGAQEKFTSDDAHKLDMPIVVLVNKGSASASEILSGALQDNKKATIVGTNTYGKGVIQSVMGLNDGTGLVITTAQYFTPNGNRVHQVGIKPDVEVQLDENAKTDNQLQKAIEVLKTKM